MSTLQKDILDQIATAASVFQQQRTGLAPQSVAVAFVDDTLVITLHGALSPAEKVLARSAAGAAQIQEFHRQLFATSSAGFRREVERIIGVSLLDAAAEVEPTSSAIVHVFANGQMVQMFLLAKPLPASPLGAAPKPAA